jgi:hypothetical protein
MSLCAFCGLSLLPREREAGLCHHHHRLPDDAWADENRIVCDFIHRKQEPPRVLPSDVLGS